MRISRIPVIVFALLLVAGPAVPQTTTGVISGLITDTQEAPLNGVTIRATNTATGLTREAQSGPSGVYSLAGLEVGTYEVIARLTGLQTYTARAVVLSIGRNITLDITMPVAARAEAVTVEATAPLVSTRSSAVGEVVDLDRIEGMPLNGRQFANLAATVGGVGLSFHTDSTKSAQYSPQISGGNGRNINYIVDGGDNNDDAVGGLLQLFPLEAVQEFTVLTQRFDAEYGRSNGAVLNVVTKSGTNKLRGSWFTLTRDDAMNAQTFTERLNNVAKQAYQRHQFGGSLGGPIVANHTHFFGAYEGTRQSAKQVVSTAGAFPGDGIFDVPFHEHLLTGKLTTTFGPRHYASLRYAHDQNIQTSGAGSTIANSAWATSTNHFNSVNVNHNWTARPSLLNEVVVQYADFVNDIVPTSIGPAIRLSNNVRGGGSALAPQSTEQIKWQFRDDLSWTTTGIGGISHELRAGVNWIHEPRLRLFNGSGIQGLYTLGASDLNGPVTMVQLVGSNGTVNFPLEQYGFYAQDDWRVSNRLTLNLGLRWDYVDGLPIDQRGSANFQAMQQAGAAGLFAGTLLDDFGKQPRPDRDNVQPRLGAALDLFGDGRDVVRGGWGLYTDFGYIASNAVTAAFDAAHAGVVFQAIDNSGLRKLDGTLFRLGDPLDTISFRNTVTGEAAPTGEVVSPLLEQPYTRQANVGWSHQLDASTVISADYVRVDGRDLNMRLRPNVVINPGVLPQVRLLSAVNISPTDSSFRTALSKGSSRYDGLILSFRRRLSRGVDCERLVYAGQGDERCRHRLRRDRAELIQDIRDPSARAAGAVGAHRLPPPALAERYRPRALGCPRRADFLLSLGAPVHTFEGRDLNGDGTVNDRTEHAYRYTGIGADNKATFEEEGTATR
jgi:outer membrane receptor protein involved in Fe transport